MTKADFHSAVHAECRDFKAKASQFDACRASLDSDRKALFACQGQNQMLRDIDQERIRLAQALSRQEAKKITVTEVVVWTVVGVVVGGVVGAVAF